jgi:predicted PurR-regulated permease PerM
MPFLDTNHQRAALLITLLSVGLAFALAPFATGLLGIPVLFVIFQPLHRWLSTRLKPALAAVLVVALAIIGSDSSMSARRSRHLGSRSFRGWVGAL